jgi:hypothetical protein
VKGRKKKPAREDSSQAAVRVMNTIIAKHEGSGATLVPGVTDEDPNTGRRIEKKPKK